MPRKHPEMPPPRRVLIVDDHPGVREGLALQLATQPDLAVCGEAEDVPAALALLAADPPDVAIVDISLRSGNGLDLIRRIRQRHPAVAVLVWSMYPENLYAERALRAGAHGYLHKGRATRHVLDALRAVLAGRVYVSGEMADELLARVVAGKPADRSPIDTLSDRELEAFELIGHGLTTEAIAARMHVSPKTVETYRARIKEKLGLSNLVELIQRPVTSDPGAPAMDPIEKMPDVVSETFNAQERNERRGEVAPFTCPECGGALWQVDDTGLIRFRCHVGHAYNGDALLAEQSEALEAALWTAVRTFRERAVLGRQLARQERDKGNLGSAERFDEQAAQSARYADLIVEHVLSVGNDPNGETKAT